MSDFRRQFLDDSRRRLGGLREKLAAAPPPDLGREIFRAVHTVKGGAQTFGLTAAARLAAGLENLLAAEPADPARIAEALDRLAALLDPETAPDAADDFAAGLEAENRARRRSRVALTRLPLEVFEQFSATERRAAIAALAGGKQIFCIEIGFEAADFADAYRELRARLAERVEIVAALPAARFAADGRLGFRIYLAGDADDAALRQLLESRAAVVFSYACADETHAAGLYEMLGQVAAHGERLADRNGKQIGLTIVAGAVELTAATAARIFEILLHLVRNAVDHAIEADGTIEIRLFETPDGLRVTVADDGRGIDLEKVRARAAAARLLAPDAAPDEAEMLALIFAPGLSTAPEITETSGRGVGLDAARAAVAALHGKISVRRRKPQGAVFEFFVPRENL